MTNTYQILINWDKGQAFAERMAAKIIGIEGYQEIDPQSPVGGPDGTKDIICYKEGEKFVVGCFFGLVFERSPTSPLNPHSALFANKNTSL